MTLFLTPEKFRTMGLGSDLGDPDDGGIEDVELASILARAQSIVDAYCTVPRLPYPHSFLGGTISLDDPEQHFWRLPENDFDPGSRRVYPYHWPIKDVIRFRVKVTNTQYVDVGASEMFINNTERYLEVISLAFTGIGLFGAILPTLGLMRPVAEISYDYGYQFSALGEVLYPTDARTYRAANQHWSGTPVIYIDGVVQNPSDYSVDPYEGTVTFNSGVGLGTVSADYGYLLPPEIRDAQAIIAAHLIAERENQQRGMGSIQSLRVGEVALAKPVTKRKVTADTLSDLLPEAASMLDAHKFGTIR